TLNIAGATRLRTHEGLTTRRLVYYGTDPVYDDIVFATGGRVVRQAFDEYDDFVTYGENIGRPDCPIPPLPRLPPPTRQPILLDCWHTARAPREQFTTVRNWRVGGHDIIFEGETYYWSKDREFMKFIDLPRRVGSPVELAMGLTDGRAIRPGLGDLIPALGM